MEEHEQALEFERRHLSELQLTPKHLSHHPYFGYSMNELKLSEGLKLFTYLINVAISFWLFLHD
jgi:hypothetical protein